MKLILAFTKMYEMNTLYWLLEIFYYEATHLVSQTATLTVFIIKRTEIIYKILFKHFLYNYNVFLYIALSYLTSTQIITDL